MFSLEVVTVPAVLFSTSAAVSGILADSSLSGGVVATTAGVGARESEVCCGDGSLGLASPASLCIEVPVFPAE